MIRTLATALAVVASSEAFVVPALHAHSTASHVGHVAASSSARGPGEACSEFAGLALADDAPRTVFDKIISGEVPSEVVFEDDLVLAFKDINPAAPFHALVIPKQRNGLTQLRKSNREQHEALLGRVLWAAGHVGSVVAGLEGFRVVVNDGTPAGQTVLHLHAHVIGGRPLAWPPG